MAPVQDWHSPLLLPLLSLFKAMPRLMFTHRGICQVGNLRVYGQRFVYDKLIPCQSVKTPGEDGASSRDWQLQHFPFSSTPCFM